MIAEAVYNPSTTYAVSDPAIFNSLHYVSSKAGNKSNQPDTSPAFWAVQGTQGNGNAFGQAQGVPAFGTGVGPSGETLQGNTGYGPALASGVTPAGTPQGNTGYGPALTSDGTPTEAQRPAGYGFGRTGDNHFPIQMPTVGGPATTADGTPSGWSTLGQRISDLEVRLRTIEVQLSSFNAAFNQATPGVR